MANVTYISRDVSDSYDDETLQAQERPGHPGGPAGGDSGLDLRQLLATLWRRKWIVVATTALLTLLAFFAAMQAKPLYVAQAVLVVANERERATAFEEVLQGGNYDYYTSQTEAAVIMSRSLAEKVVDDLGLTESPHFNPALAPPEDGVVETLSLKQRIKALLPDWLLALGRERAPARPPLSPEAEAELLRQSVIDAVQASTEVLPSERSRVLVVRFTAPDPQLAADAANALADTYINETILRKFDANARATDWLNSQVAELKARLERSEKALSEHRRQIGYVNLEGRQDILAQQLGQLSTELVRARTERAEAEARFAQVQRLLQSEEGIESAGTVLNAPLIQKLREQEAAVIREQAELSTQLRERHPRMQLKQSELAELREKIRGEVAKIGIGLGNELELARVREQNLSGEVEGLKTRIEEQNEALLTLRALQSEVDANKEIYEALLTRFKQTDIQDSALQTADARLISRAIPPERAAFPRTGLITAVAFVVAAVLGVLLVFLVEQLDAGFRTQPQLEAATGIAAVGVVPKLAGRLRRSAPQDVVIERPNCAFSEAIRGLRTALLLAGGRQPPKVVMVCSSLPGEGKSSVALAVARAAAKAGQRALVIDADMRHPSLHEGLRVANLAGLAEFLAGEATAEEVLEIDPRSGVHFITAGHQAPHPTDMLGSPRLRELLGRLRQVYDLVVIDTPPVLAVSDALVLSKLADKVLYLVRWGRTRREVVQAGVRLMIDARADLAGLVLTQVDMRKQASYGDGGARYYYGANQRYYLE